MGNNKLPSTPRFHAVYEKGMLCDKCGRSINRTVGGVETTNGILCKLCFQSYHEVTRIHSRSGGSNPPYTPLANVFKGFGSVSA